jgi:hypothetical protein
MGNRRSFRWGKSGRCLRLTTHLRLVPRFRIHGAIPPLSMYALMVCVAKTSTFCLVTLQWCHLLVFGSKDRNFLFYASLLGSSPLFEIEAEKRVTCAELQPNLNTLDR